MMQSYETMRRYLRIVGMKGLTLALLGKIFRHTFYLRMRHPLMRLPCVVRCPSSDVPTYEQVFLKHEYDCQLRRSPQVIIDAGANIGLASIYFATRFPEARIIAIEPEDGNLEVLRLNTREYLNVTVFPGALWGRDEQLHVVDNSYGNWGFMTSSVGDPQSKAASIAQETCGITVPSLLKKYGIQRVDIFKIDIEGAEKELFEDCAAWIEQVDALIVELHDRMKPGCAASFRAGTKGFDMKWQQGENEFRARRGGCMVAAANEHADGLA